MPDVVADLAEQARSRKRVAKAAAAANGAEKVEKPAKPKIDFDLARIDLMKTVAEAGIIRSILFVPPSMLASDLMSRMQAARTQMALVIDEYGGTDGLVSHEDIVEMVVGDIDDEHDKDEAMFSRRAMAVEKERAIKENELATEVELARRQAQLIEQKGANQRLDIQQASANERTRIEAEIERQALVVQAETLRLSVAATAEAERNRLIAEAYARDVLRRAVGDSESRKLWDATEVAKEAARIALKAGCAMVITRGDVLRPMTHVLQGARCTWFVPDYSPVAARKLWIAGALSPHGRLRIAEIGPLPCNLQRLSPANPAGRVVLDHGGATEQVVVKIDRDDQRLFVGATNRDRHGVDQGAVHQHALVAGDRLEHAGQRIRGTHGGDEMAARQPDLVAGADFGRHAHEGLGQVGERHALEVLLHACGQLHAAEQAAAAKVEVKQG